MANFAVVVDPDVERCRRFVSAVVADVAPVAGLLQDECAVGSFRAAWAAAPGAPVAVTTDARTAAIVWGEATSVSDARHIGAGELADAWSPAFAGNVPPAWSGFHAACLFNAPDAVAVGADLLGLFPVYYWESGDVFVAASSPELIGRHPSFRRALNPVGLVGILLTGGTVGGETTWQGVRRLAPGYLLVRRPGDRAREIAQFTFPVSDRDAALPFEAAVERLHDTLRGAVGRMARTGEEIGLLLSGGRDSRLVAGLLHEQGMRPRALTFGRGAEHEVRCARRVARALSMPQRVADVPSSDYPDFAELHVKWEHLSSPLSGLYTWGTHTHLPELGRRVATGHLLELVLGGVSVEWAYSEQTRRFSYEHYFKSANRRAIATAALRKLLRADVFGDAVDTVLEQIRSTWTGLAGDDWQRALRCLFQQWARAHPGSAAWRMSFGAWPVLLALDQAVLELGASLLPGIVAHRRAEDELLRRKYPQLARLPLDANAPHVVRLLPRPGRALIDRLLGHRGSAWLRELSGRRERRYYRRVYDFNGPGWRGVRTAVEPHRHRLHDLVHPAALDELLPPPWATVRFDEPILDSNGPKMLLGLMLWARDHL